MISAQGERTPTESCDTGPRQGTMFVIALYKLWLPPNFTSHVTQKGHEMTGY